MAMEAVMEAVIGGDGAMMEAVVMAEVQEVGMGAEVRMVVKVAGMVAG